MSVEVTPLDVSCPSCGAARSNDCRGGPPHIERVRLAGRLFYAANRERIVEMQAPAYARGLVVLSEAPRSL